MRCMRACSLKSRDAEPCDAARPPVAAIRMQGGGVQRAGVPAEQRASGGVRRGGAAVGRPAQRAGGGAGRWAALWGGNRGLACCCLGAHTQRPSCAVQPAPPTSSCLPAATGAKEGDVWKPFYAAQQRFFKLLCISMKVGACAGRCRGERGTNSGPCPPAQQLATCAAPCCSPSRPCRKLRQPVFRPIVLADWSGGARGAGGAGGGLRRWAGVEGCGATDGAWMDAALMCPLLLHFISPC